MTKLQTIGQGASDLNISRDTLRRLIKAGEVKAVRVARRVMVPVSEIERVSQRGAGSYVEKK